MLCADDFSQNEDISYGILTLLENKRINATSCMTNCHAWPTMSRLLHPLHSQAFIGLHFNLTEGVPLSAQWKARYGDTFFSLPELISRAYTTGLDPLAINAELHAQWDKFCVGMHQSTPDFIDGHQHIHQLPGIAAVLIAFCKKQPFWKGFVRQTYNGNTDWFCTQAFPKHQILALLGGMRFKKLLNNNNIPYNTSFAGITHFDNKKPFPQLFSAFLQKISDNGLIMCHPGNISQDKADPLYQQRHIELRYFQSDLFLQDLNRSHCILKDKNIRIADNN